MMLPRSAGEAALPRRHRMRALVGFSLVESLIAISILALVFTAIASAIGAGSASAGEARQRVVATLAADELLAEVLASEWDDLQAWHGYEEEPGESLALDGASEDARRSIVRSVRIIDETLRLEPAGVEIDGRHVHVTVNDLKGRLLVRLDRFVPSQEQDP